MRKSIAWAMFAVAVATESTWAHHSFAVFFDDNKIVEVMGTVSDFQFTNPHGVITFTAKGPKGKTESWKAETNAPTLLRRRGWTKDSLKPGDVVSVEGWLARDGSNYMRMRKVTRSDGTVLSAAVANETVSSKGER